MQLILKKFEHEQIHQELNNNNFLFNLLELLEIIEKEKFKQNLKSNDIYPKITDPIIQISIQVNHILENLEDLNEKIIFLRAFIDGLERTKNLLYTRKSLPNVIQRYDYEEQLDDILYNYPILIKNAREKLSGLLTRRSHHHIKRTAI